MKLALHRSVTFWSGLLVMAFICWAWWDSMRFFSYAGSLSLRAENESAAFLIARTPNMTWAEMPGLEAVDRFIISKPRKVATPAFPVVRFVRGLDLDPFSEIEDPTYVIKPHFKDGDGTPVFSSLDLRMSEMTTAPKEDWYLQLPHWLLLLSVALPWTALLLWRARRRKRIFTP